MEPVKFSAKSTARVWFARPSITDADIGAVVAALKNPKLTEGPSVAEFQERFTDYVGGGCALAVSSCTAALHLAWIALGVSKGDEIIIPALTHVATAHAVEATGAKPVFVDVLPNGNIDLEQIRITPNTRGISPVHFLGRPCDMASLRGMVRKSLVYIVEDCALALGSFLDGKHVGLWGDAGAFSFYPAKHITSGEGGMLVLKDAEMANRAMAARSFGQTHTTLWGTNGHSLRYGEFDVESFGLNYRMSDINAALGSSQLSRLAENLSRRGLNAKILAAGLEDFECIPGHYGFSVICPEHINRDEAREELFKLAIETSIYYPVPVPYLTYYREKYKIREKFPNAEKIASRSITLPVGPHLGPDAMSWVIQNVREVLS